MGFTAVRLWDAVTPAIEFDVSSQELPVYFPAYNSALYAIWTE